MKCEIVENENGPTADSRTKQFKPQLSKDSNPSLNNQISIPYNSICIQLSSQDCINS